MIDLPDYVWEDIERELLEGHWDNAIQRAAFRESIDRVIELVDMERARQLRKK
jgi:hypothetical protein